MVAVYQGGDQDFSTMAFGIPNYDTLQYLDQQFQSIDRSLFFDPSFIDRAYESYYQFGGSEAIQRARALLNATNTLSDSSQIYYLKDLVQVQTASPIMQRYIMADPIVRALYQNNLCDGYSSSYVDHDPGKIGEDHYDYRRVMNGILEYTEGDEIELDKGEHLVFRTKFYLDDTDEPNLYPSEQFDILSTWEIVRKYIALKGEDPTDLYGNKL